MDPQVVKDESPFRHLFILKTPSHHPEDLYQLRVLQMTSTIRHRIKIFPGAPYGYYIVDDDRTEGEHEILAFFQGDDVHQVLSDLRKARRPDPPALISKSQSSRPTRGSPSPSYSRYGSSVGMVQGSQHHVPSTSHASIPSSESSFPTASIPAPTFQTTPPSTRPTLDSESWVITAMDRNSLIPLKQGMRPATEADHCLYIMPIEIEPSPHDVGVTGICYKLPIDTGSCPVWFFQRGFSRIVPQAAHTDQGRPVIVLGPWGPQNPPREGPTVSGHVADNSSYAQINFADGSSALLHRYPRGHEISALLPSWDWESGREIQRSKLRLPRVLAYAANDHLARQLYDGNLGLALPGNTGPFDYTQPSTFIEAISLMNSHPNQSDHVEAPTQMTLRLLHPEVVDADCPSNVQSYLYYGKYWPCGFSEGAGINDQIRVPAFTPKIYVLPTVNLAPALPGQPLRKGFMWWAPRVISMALLVPKVPRANRQAPVPCRDSEDDWTAKPIDFPNGEFTITGVTEDSDKVRGLPVVLDTCSAFSVLPDTICKAIATQWLGLPHAAHDMYTRRAELSCPDTLDLDDHDIRFTFLGEGNTTVRFQCPASRFLRAVWPDSQKTGFCVPIASQSSADPSACWIFGQNFFWTAFVRLDCAYRGTMPIEGDGTEVTVRLAPQRVKDAEGKYWLDEKSIRFHQYPGRIEAERLGAAGLKYDD